MVVTVGQERVEEGARYLCEQADEMVAPLERLVVEMIGLGRPARTANS